MIRKLTLGAVAALLLGAIGAANATIINVPADQPTIQAGIDAAVDGDTVIVADGTYVIAPETALNFHGKAITVRSANGPNNCGIYTPPTILPHGLVVIGGETAATVLSGFTISMGGIDGSDRSSMIMISDSSPTITNCVFMNCRHFGYGGAIGIYTSDGVTCAPTISNCVFSMGSGSSGGGAVMCAGGADVVFTGCTFFGNMAGEKGGAVYITGQSSAVFSDCTFLQNHAQMGGAVMVDQGGSATVINSLFVGNEAVVGGGAIATTSPGPLDAGGTCNVYDATFNQNAVNPAGSGAAAYGNVSFTNSICAGSMGGSQFSSVNSHITATYCDVQGGWPGAGNIDADPLFTQPIDYSNETYNYSLLAGSPCIGAGSVALIPSGVTTDIAGNPRTVNGMVDMGAYESAFDITPPTTTASLAGPAGKNGWYTGAVQVTLSATDPDGASDVAATYYTIDGSAQQTYGGPFTVTGDGVHTLTYWSVDQAGNIETPHPGAQISIDSTPPAITAAVDTAVLWPPTGTMMPVTITGSISDAGSGVDLTSGVYSTVDSEGTLQPAGPVTINSDGTYSFTVLLQASRLGTDKNGRTYTITIQAADLAGNVGSGSVTVIVPHDKGN